MAKFNPVEFFKEMQGILKQFKEELIKEVDGKLDEVDRKLGEIRREVGPPPPALSTTPLEPRPFPPLGLLRKDVFRVEWKGHMTRKLTDEEAQLLSQELFTLLEKYGLDTLEAKKIKEQ